MDFATVTLDEDNYEQNSDRWQSCRDIPKKEDDTDSVELEDETSHFEFQNEMIFNSLLPYADKLDDEADALFAKIKANFGRSVMLRKIKPDCVIWANMLNKYIALYDFRFSKEDHINFIKLLYELVTIPELDSALVALFVDSLKMLLRCQSLLASSELELPWRPLYNVYQYWNRSFINFYYVNYLKDSLNSLIDMASIHFPLNATQEILDELRPQLYPFDNMTLQDALETLQLFLPIHVAPEHHSLGHELWFKEFMNLWEVLSPNDGAIGDIMMTLMADLASNNIGTIDWEPYLPLMFTRFIQSFDLPVYYKDTNCRNNTALDPCDIALWIASVLGNNSSAQMYLDKFLKTIETYLYPANYGPYLNELTEFLVVLSHNVVERLNAEGYKTQPTEKNPRSKSYKLTDADVDSFVNSMMPIAMIAMFNEHCSQIFNDGLRYLATMRPNIVIPKVLEKIYPNDGIEIEPHKLIIALDIMTAISRSLVQGSGIVYKDYAFPDGPLHVLPLLFTSLSGIDPNDLNKTLATFRLIATYATMIPIVDCSKSTAEMSDDERLVCEKTSEFEDFVLQFMDKILSYIDSVGFICTRLENHRTIEAGNDAIQNRIEIELGSVFSIVLSQLSHSIFMTALGKLRAFVVANFFEIKVSGRLVAVICQKFSEVNGQDTIKALLPFLAAKVLETIGEGDEVIQAENLDIQLLYPLLLVSNLVLTQGDALLPHTDTLSKIIDKAIRLKQYEGNLMGRCILSNIMQSLTNIRFVMIDWDLDNPNYPYIKEWGQTAKVKRAKIKTYVPGEEELQVLQELFMRYFMPAVESIQKFIETKDSLTRDDLRVSLRIILNILKGCDAALPFWDEPPLKIKPYEDCVEPFSPILGYTGKVCMPDGSNVRYFLVQTMTALQEIMLENITGDTKTLHILNMIWERLIGNMSVSPEKDIRFSMNYRISKKSVENEMIGCNGWFPQFILTRVWGQHCIRKMYTTLALTETHKSILINLLKLSTCEYRSTRKYAQQTLAAALGAFPNAHTLLTSHFVEILKLDPTEHHHALKGMLHLLNTRSSADKEYIVAKQDWEFYKSIWTTLVLSKPSEKSSIKRLETSLLSISEKTFLNTKNIQLEIPDSCVLAAANLWKAGMEPSIQQPSENEILKGIEELHELGKANLKVYNKMLDEMSDALLEKNLHQCRRDMARIFICFLFHPDQTFSPRLVRFYVNSLIHDSVVDRRLSLALMLPILKRLKRKHTKKMIGVPSSSTNQTSVQPGRRPDNEWLQYKYAKRPTNSIEWDKPRYVHKSYISYYAWPRELEVYAPSSEQPSFDVNSMSDQDKEIHLFFSNSQNVDKFFYYVDLQDMQNCRLQMFKNLFRNHGDTFLDHFLPHLRRLVADKQENSQRWAATIIGGLIKGSKHWPYDMTERMWTKLLPILRSAFSNITTETITHWTICILYASKNRDPNRLHWLLELLMEQSQLGESEVSYVECFRLEILNCVLFENSWRLSELLHRSLLRLEKRLEDGPFQNVRDHLADILVSVFHPNVKFDSVRTNGCMYPKVSDFVDKMYPKLLPLIEDDESTKVITSAFANITIDSDAERSLQPLSSSNNAISEREKTVRLFKTICSWMTRTLNTSNLDIYSSFYKIYPLICKLENSDKDEELSLICLETLGTLAQTLTLPKYVPIVLESVSNVSDSSSWLVRVSCLEFLKVFVFQNMSILLSNESWIRKIQDIVLRLLEDEKLEVRMKAAQVLNGLLHCTIIPDQEALLDEFKNKAKTKLVNGKKKPSSDEVEMINAVRLRHAGVLGMCAFIQAHPYDVSKYVPLIFECLNSHLNDPEPIPSTIRNTVADFKHTHYDGWAGLRALTEHFTEEQFTILDDLMVLPSYYA